MEELITSISKDSPVSMLLRAVQRFLRSYGEMCYFLARSVFSSWQGGKNFFKMQEGGTCSVNGWPEKTSLVRSDT